jgi:hypothetical protein
MPNRLLVASVLINLAAMAALWKFGSWIIHADDTSSFNRWLFWIVFSAAMPAVATLWFLFKGQKTFALLAVFAAVPLWFMCTMVQVVLDLVGLKF